MKRLVIIDRYTIDWLDRAREVARPGDEWYLVILCVSDAWFKRKFADQLSRLGYWEFVNLLPFVRAATEQVKSFVILLIACLPEMQVGGMTLARLLDSPRGTRWWFTEICEKSGWRTPFINCLYQLALIHMVIGQQIYDEVWLNLTTPYITSILQRVPFSTKILTLVQVLPPRLSVVRRYLLNAILVVGGMAIVRWILIVVRWRSQFGDSRLFFFSIYPYWWTRAMSREATDRFFSVIPNDMGARFLVWLSHPRQMWKWRHSMIEVMHDKKMIPLQMFVRWRDVFHLFNPLYILKLRRAMATLRRQKKFEFEGLDVSSLVCDEVTNSLVSREWLNNCLLTSAIDESVSRAPDATLVYRDEFQPLESALLFGVNRRWRTIGFYHPPFTENFLAYQFQKGEMRIWGERGNWHLDRPLPDRIIAVAEVMREHLVAQEFPKHRIKLCGPQRQGELVSYLRLRLSRKEMRMRLGLPNDNTIMFVAAGSVDAENEMLFAALADACEGLGAFRLIIKPHPAKTYGDESIQLALRILGDAATLIPPDGKLYDYLSAADATVCIPSTIVFEAITLGVMPIAYESAAVYATNSLANYDAAMFVVRDVNALRGALQDVIANGEKSQAKRHKWDETIHKVLGDLRTPLATQLARALD
jgi:hypothetical protein